ncbi:uncharacterized protein BCR38DRAFT_527168 [Pseudomassariella vexata]|uniref:Uncharacterized protein n=1 Tax=Pseudomassariella vexata TaxID=1141098 RepID=A0A1Y2DJ10_9PEZI|nr:uncharacterized protein BCR38DRAFT_527168 [Pseudomassariella vexata]ORY59202.1 hypothetical protein BCR38DRAFT_527168 [Pseudomassariella vexata]
MDVCTGKQTFRSITTANTNFAQRLKFTATDRYVREYRIATAAAPVLTKNNITVGLYVQPVTAWIQPEQVNPGLAPIANAFSKFKHLAKGFGLNEEGNIWGPLDPFLQTGVTVFKTASCPLLQSVQPLLQHPRHCIHQWTSYA